jgi:hypothetical protein
MWCGFAGTCINLRPVIRVSEVRGSKRQDSSCGLLEQHMRACRRTELGTRENTKGVHAICAIERNDNLQR